MFLISKAIAAAIDVSIPCISCKYANDASPVGLIANFYEMAIALSGVLALGMIIYAGIKRIIGANNPKEVSESNDIIYNALLGIVLLFGAYILLNTINPQLTKLELPVLTKVEERASEGILGEGNPNDGYCTKEHTGKCSSDVLECRKGENGEYKCVPKDNIVWGCKGKFSSLAEDGETVEITERWLNCMSRTLPNGTQRTKSVCDSNCVNLLRQYKADNTEDLCVQTTSDVCKINN